MDNLSGKVNNTKTIVGVAVFSLLLFPVFFVPSIPIFLILIIPVFSSLVLALVHYRRTLSKTAFVPLSFIYLIVIATAAPSILLTSILIAISPAFAIFLPVLFVLLYLLMPGIITINRFLICFSALCCFTASVLIVSMIALEEMNITEGAPSSGEGIVTDIYRPARRYRFAFDREGNKVCFSVPYRHQYEIFSIDSTDTSPIIKSGHKIARFTYTPDNNHVIALDWETGPLIMNRDNFQVKIEKNLPLPHDSDPFHYEGIAFHSTTNEVLISRGNGELLFLSFPDLTIQKKRKCIGESPLLFWTSVQDIFLLEKENLLLTTTFSGYLYVYDLEQDRITASLFFGGPMTNIVRSHDGNSFYVGSMFWGLIYRIRISDMKIIDKMHVETGIRFMTILPENEILAVSDFFNGNIMIYNAVEHDMISRVSSGPRIEWIDVTPDGDFIIVSHTLGFTAFNVSTLMTKHPWAYSNLHFPFYLFHQDEFPGFFLGETKDYMKLSGYKLLFAIILLSCLLMFCGLGNNKFCFENFAEFLRE